MAAAAKDDFRLVRTSSASSPARYPQRTVSESVFKELEAGLICFPDAGSSHYNIGNYYEACGKPTQALAAYEQAMRLRSDVIPPLVNAALLVARQGNLEASLRYLTKAEKIDPKHPAVNLNLGLALAEQGNRVEAEQHFRTALTNDATMAQAAYNLGVLLNRTSVSEEGVGWCRKAAELQPQNLAYVYTLAFDFRRGVQPLLDLLGRRVVIAGDDLPVAAVGEEFQRLIPLVEVPVHNRDRR